MLKKKIVDNNLNVMEKTGKKWLVKWQKKQNRFERYTNIPYECSNVELRPNLEKMYSNIKLTFG